MNKIKILVVDDEAVFAKMMRFNLEATGDYEVECEDSSSQVIPHAEAFRPDLILLDVVMPGLDGGSVKHQIQDHPHLRDIPIIFVTALVSRDDAAGGLFVETGGQLMLPKPVELPHLIQAIETRLAAHARASAPAASPPVATSPESAHPVPPPVPPPRTSSPPSPPFPPPRTSPPVPPPFPPPRTSPPPSPPPPPLSSPPPPLPSPYYRDREP